MNKKIILLFAILLFSGFAFGKSINIIYNFPYNSGIADVKETITINDDANAYSAFLKVAESHSLELDITYYSFGAFINSINGIAGSADFSKYWQFSVNNASSMTGISAFVPANNDTVSLDYLDGKAQDALEWLLDNQKTNGEIGSNFFQSSFALMGLSLASDNNVSNTSSAVNNGLNNLLSQQANDAGFGNELYSAVAVMALLSNGKDLNSFKKSEKTTIELLKEQQLNDGGFKSGSWSSESDVDTTSWASTAFAQANSGIPLKNGKNPGDFLLLAQHSNGSWGYNAADSSESIDFTEEALIALSALLNHSKDSNVANALDWLSLQQSTEGCISDGFRTALGSIVFNAWNETSKAEKARNCLATLQNGDGSFGRASNSSNSLDTGIAVIALSGKTFPLSVSAGSDGNESDLGLNSIVKFAVEIKNTGSVKAENVKVSIEGIPADWIITEGSVDGFSEIRVGETKTAEIFVKLKSAGNFTAKAVITTDQSTAGINSNSLGFEVKQAQLSAILKIEG